jgi:uncharacterized protein involved in outer membrane biogenesis
MNRKIRKKWLRLVFLPIASLLVLVIIAFAILYTQRQRLVSLAIKDLNEKWPGELVVGGSDMAIFQNFPYISIVLNNTAFYATKLTTVKPIYEAERMYVGFSLPDILKQQYHVKGISLKNGHLDLVRDGDGKLNIAEASRIGPDTPMTKTTATELNLDIKKLVLKNMDISFLDRQNGQRIAAHIDKIKASFLVDSQLVQAGMQGSMLINYSRTGETPLFKDRRLETDIEMSYDLGTGMLKLPVAKLKLENAIFNITGTADLLHDNLLDLRFSGDKPDVKQLFAFAPESVAKELKHFRYDGELSFEGRLKGACKNGRLPLIELSFSCSNAWLNNTTAHKKLDSLAFKGYYTNGSDHSLKTSELRLLDMRARPGEGVFKGNFVLRNFTDPKISMQVNSELELGFIGAFLGIKDLQRITGHIILKMDFKELVDLSLPGQSMDKLTEGIQSELTVRNLTFRIPSYPYTIEHLDMHADMKNGFVHLDSLSFNLGNSDFHIDGSISDLPALFHHREQPVMVTLNEHSNKIIPKELMAFDSTRSNRLKEEIYGFNIGLSLQTSVNELLHPHPLPKGKFNLQHMSAAFKHYPHAFHDFGAELTINDTAVLLRNFAGNIDSSDIRFSGRIINYALWFDKVMKGKTQLAFDLKSQRLAMKDLLGRHSITHVPKDYRDEIASGLWLRSKIDLRYDSVFQFANIKIANISGELKKHAFRLDSISGNVKIGADKFVRIDTLKGKIGRSDFNMSMRLYAGADTVKRKKENYLRFSSHLLDLDELMNYKLTEEDDTAATPAAYADAGRSAHAGTFNIFQIPFIDFKAAVNVDKIKYRHLWLKNLFTNIRMQANQQLYLDTLALDVAEGKIAARAHFNGADPNKIYLRSKIRVDDVNIEKMMLKLDYFGQDYVINKNIKGRLSGQIKCYIQVHPDLTPLMENSEAELDIAIYNGQLVNFAPMQAVSSYFKDKNLSMVRFDTLVNKLAFKNGALSIPTMNINSSLGFMEISGTQSLDKQMEYYLRIPLKMVTQVGFHMLFGKKQEEVDPDHVDAIEYRDKDRKVRFMNLKIIGTPDEYKVSLGKAKKS